MQAFKMVCHCLHIEPTATKFLYHYFVCQYRKSGWISLSVWANVEGHSKFFYSDGQPRFPLYWQQSEKFNGWTREDMSSRDQNNLNLNDLNNLPKGLSCHEVINVVFSCSPSQDLAKLMRKSDFCALKVERDDKKKVSENVPTSQE
ncbi:hypothetical protein CR513_18235, partial [Mucuna pruriens]